MRVKTKWHNEERGKTLAESASVLGFIAWRAAMNMLKEMDNEGFRFRSYKHQLEVLGEMVAFLLQVSDRLAYERLEEADRAEFIAALAKHLVEHMVGNLNDVAGPGEYKKPFIDLLNLRAEEYAEHGFADSEPAHGFLRRLGQNVDAVMGGEHNKFCIEFVSEVAAPGAVKTLRKSLDDLLAE